MFCSACGESLEQFAAECSGCGKPVASFAFDESRALMVEPIPARPAKQVGPPKRANKTLDAIAWAVLVVAVSLGTLVAFFTITGIPK